MHFSPPFSCIFSPPFFCILSPLLTVPPFISEKGASDKGFKDTILWLSLLEYFKNREEEEEVVFLTGDKGFRNNEESLCKEFLQCTGKAISIKENSFYKSYIEVDEKEATVAESKYPLPDVEQLRDRIGRTITALCIQDTADLFDPPQWEYTFLLKEKVDSDYMENIFRTLEKNIEAHLFEKTVSASSVFELDNRISDALPIPMAALEDALLLFKEVRNRLPGFITQFYSAAAQFFNGNYQESQVFEEVDDDLPF